MPEIASAWVTLVASTKGMERDIRKAFDAANRNAKLDPKVDAGKVGQQGANAGKSFGSRFSASAKLDPKVDTSKIADQGEAAGRSFGVKFKTAMTAVGIGTVGALLAKQLKDALSVGLDWTNTMNTFQSVTNATSAEMDKAGAAARQLGTDISLPATSANDAAAAMTELAKGGFSVQQSMDAAKGSLQLAAAAGISATDAATIQSQALQAFGLNAGQAGKMSDTLANAANASSAEITDVAYALQAAGTVANQFGLSAEDTAAAIALLANNGIKGSDAGTLLKTSLLALTDQGKPAQGAIEQLGLTVYDAQGKFVGLHSLYGQLGDAAKRMTPEMYQAFTSILFGSDAMRIAGVAAKDGSVSYDQMRAAMDRQGAAADVAAAKTRGLPGAIERVKNNLESLQLKAYDAFQGPVTKLVDKFAAALEGVGDAAEGVGPKVAALFSGLGSSGAAQDVWSRTVAAFSGLANAAVRLGPPLATVGASLATASAALGVSAWQLFVTALEAVAGVLNTLAPLIQGLGNFMQSHQGLVTAAAGAWLLFRTVPAILGKISPATTALGVAVQTMGQKFTGAVSGVRDFGGAYRDSLTWVRQASPNISTAAAHMKVLGNNAKAAASGGLSALKGAAGGVVNALGGPFSVALLAAGAAIAVISAKNQEAQQSFEAYRDAVKRTGDAQASLNEALMNSSGALDDVVKSASVARIRALGDEFEAAGKRTGSFLDMFRGNGKSGMWNELQAWTGALKGQLPVGATVNDQITFDATRAAAAQSALDKLNLTQEALAETVYGSQAAFDSTAEKLRAMGEGGAMAADKLKEARTEFENQKAAAERVAPGIKQMSDAMRVLSDNTASAADKTKALVSALDALNPERGVLAAESAHTQVMERVAEATKEAADATGGLGDSLFKANGSINGAVTNGAALGQSIRDIVDATQQVAAAGDMDAFTKAQEQNQVAFESLAKKYGTSIGQIKAAADSLGYSDIQLILTLSGADEATQALGAVKKAFDEQPDKKTLEFPTNSIQAAKTALEQLGVKIEEVPGTHTTKITIDDGGSKQKIQDLIDAANRLPTSKTMTFNVIRDGSDREAVNALREAFGQPPRPRLVGAIVPMADGGFRYIKKPETAGLYAGRGAGTVFAEKQTGGEAYIPLAPGKRTRSAAILSEVARLFGMTVMEDGGITIETLKQYAAGISGHGYVRGGGNGDTFDTDCSGAQATIANYLTGASGRFSTGNEGGALLARGFQMGDPPPGIAAYWVGWKNGGPGGGHTAGTIVDPNGGNVNVEMGGASGNGQYGGGTGASAFPNRAWIAVGGGEDTNSSGSSSAAVKRAQASVTSAKASTASAQNAVDKSRADLDKLKADGASQDKQDAAQKKLDVAQQKLTAAQERQSAAETRLSEVKDKQASKAETGGDDAKSFGQSLTSGLFGGLMESIGLPGFANLLDSPNFKSGQALLNAFSGPIKGAMEGKLGIQQDGWSPGMPIGDEGNIVGLPSFGLPGVGDFISPLPEAGKQPNANATHNGSGAQPGPTNINYSMSGVDPKAGLQKADAHANQSYRRSGMPAVRPR